MGWGVEVGAFALSPGAFQGQSDAALTERIVDQALCVCEPHSGAGWASGLRTGQGWRLCK